jgi:DNA-binding response OmpR family regulator
VDDEAKTVMLDGEQVVCTPIEFGILRLLTASAGKVFSMDQIYESVWNEPSYNPENTVAVHIRRIREKIEIDPRNPRYLKVVWGIGYKIEKIK